ncbi:MAG: MBL fold metallo-hydrolase [Paracoccus sp. (in: a-proteobacteria)]|uniref:MBL fold metallo-hydrolase n=1 Tax=Paracoccus sp. TaxID=267 RepID=UPI0026DF11CD|nr:MBL fold metallo-hydrolase [Paracoccus sp. (in: a-proteobacteria)]MDO5614463.1 MBL fold metallo-hydrolase [Paracoccus sp. (in: a-proteobacteria)]
MMTRRDALKLSAAGVAVLALPAHASGALDWTFYQADEAGFLRTPVLLSGETDAILIDGGFTLSDGRAVADAIKATGKRLTTIYVTCNDPDYYFSLRPIVDAFPDAQVIARPDTVAAINGNVEGKLAVWGPQLGDNGPQTLADVVVPAASEATSLELEGQTIEIVEFPDMHDRRYLWVPSLQAVFGGVLVYSGIHVWVADNATPESRAQWIAALDEIIARNPAIVVPGHQAPGAAQGIPAVRFTRDYLQAFDKAAETAANSEELIAAMKAQFPDLGSESSLELGAKVAKGEMQWG